MGDAVFANPQLHEYCDKKRIAYFIRLPRNRNLDKLNQLLFSPVNYAAIGRKR